MKSRVALVVAIVLGAVATLGVYAVIQKTKQQSDMAKSKDRVACAKRELAAGEELSEEEMVVWKEIPSDYVSKDHIKYTDIKTFTQQKLSSRVSKDAPIMRHYFQIEAADISQDKPSQHYRAISIPVDFAQGVSGLLRPNQRVDVLASFKVKPVMVGAQDEEGRLRPPSEAEIEAVWGLYAKDNKFGGMTLPESADGQSTADYAEDVKEFFTLSAMKADKVEIEVTITLIQNATVLATDSRTESGTGIYESVTLQVTPEQAQMLVFAMNVGKIHISLRNKFDTQPARLAPEYIEKIIGPEKMGGRRTIGSTGSPGE